MYFLQIKPTNKGPELVILTGALHTKSVSHWNASHCMFYVVRKLVIFRTKYIAQECVLIVIYRYKQTEKRISLTPLHYESQVWEFIRLIPKLCATRILSKYQFWLKFASHQLRRRSLKSDQFITISTSNPIKSQIFDPPTHSLNSKSKGTDQGSYLYKIDRQLLNGTLSSDTGEQVRHTKSYYPDGRMETREHLKCVIGRAVNDAN